MDEMHGKFWAQTVRTLSGFFANSDEMRCRAKKAETANERMHVYIEM